MADSLTLINAGVMRYRRVGDAALASLACLVVVHSVSVA